MAIDEDVPSLGAMEGLVGYHLRRASATFVADFNRILAGTGVRQALFGVIATVAASPGINQGAVGRALGIQRANMVSLVTEVIEKGWIRRETAPEDRRAFALFVTDAGREMIETAAIRIQTHEDALLAPLSGDERALLLDLLRRIEKGEEDRYSGDEA